LRSAPAGALFSIRSTISRLRYHQLYAPKIVERIEKSAPAGADLKSWRY